MARLNGASGEYPMLQHGMKNLHPQPRLPISPNLIIWALVIVLIGILVPTTVSKVMVNLNAYSTSSVTADTTAALLTSSNWQDREQAIAQLAQAARGGSSEAVSQLGSYFQLNEFLTTDAMPTARALASVDSRPAYQVLIRALRQNQPPARRMAAMAALEESKPTVSRLLVAGLQDSDAGVRAASAELIGYRHEVPAAEAVTAATYDSDPTVREAATWTLGGDLAVWQSLPRMQMLGITDPDPRVRDAARLAEARIDSNIARALGLDSNDIRFVSVAAATGQFYVTTNENVYVVRDSSTWRLVNALPAAPTALAAGGADGKTVYLGSESDGPFRSVDGGETWQSIRSGLPAAERLAVTSLVIDSAPDKSVQQIYMTVEAALGTTELHITPLGMFHSADGGQTWSLVDSAQSGTDLAIDPATPKVLYGMNETGIWQTTIP
jgi:hypothetical protein